jgi:hypothetical protein
MIDVLDEPDLDSKEIHGQDAQFVGPSRQDNLAEK